MPQVQVLPQVPGFGERLIDQLQKTGGELSQAYQKRRSNEALYGMLAQAGGAGSSLSPLSLFGIQQAAAPALGEQGAAGLTAALASQQKTASKEQHDVQVYNKDYIDTLLSGYESSKAEDLRLSRLENLNKNEKLATPAIAAISETLNIPLSVLSNPASEEFAKVSQDLMSNITSVFGNRILQVEVQNFLKTIPTLMNSKEGRDRVIAARKVFNKAKEINFKAYQDVRKQKGITYDLHEDVLAKASPELDKLADEFHKYSGGPPTKPKAPAAVPAASAAPQSTAPATAPAATPAPTPGQVEMIGPDGSRGFVDVDKVEAAKVAGARLVNAAPAPTGYRPIGLI